MKHVFGDIFTNDDSLYQSIMLLLSKPKTNREWLQDLPSDQFARCITSIAFLMKHMDVWEWEKMFLNWLDEPCKQ